MFYLVLTCDASSNECQKELIQNSVAGFIFDSRLYIIFDEIFFDDVRKRNQEIEDEITTENCVNFCPMRDIIDFRLIDFPLN